MQHSHDATVARPSIRALTALRFVAAMEVVLFHVWHGASSPPREFDLAYNLTSGGHEAVAFFFVLSGFILTYVYSGRDADDGLTVRRAEFWNSRASRVVPAYFFGLLLMLPIFVYDALVTAVVPMEVFVSGMVLVPVFLQAWWPPAALAWNVPAWSLSVEVFFYALFPGLARAARGMSRGGFLACAYLAVAGMTLFRWSIAPHPESQGDPALLRLVDVYLPLPLIHLPLFILGMALGRWFLFRPRSASFAYCAMLAVGVAGMALLLAFRPLLPWWAMSNIVIVPLLGLLICGAAGADVALRPLTPFAVVFLGEISYAMYILHWPLRFWWDWAMRKFLEVKPPPVGNLLGFLLLLLAVSSLSFLYLETPLRRRFSRNRDRDVREVLR